MNIFLEVPVSKNPVGPELTLGPALVGWSTTVSILWGAVCVIRDYREIVSSHVDHSHPMENQPLATPALAASAMLQPALLPTM